MNDGNLVDKCPEGALSTLGDPLKRDSLGTDDEKFLWNELDGTTLFGKEDDGTLLKLGVLNDDKELLGLIGSCEDGELVCVE